MESLDTSLPTTSHVYSLVNQKLREPHIRLKPSDKGILKLSSSNIDFDKSAVVSRVATKGRISSQQDLILENCPQLGDISAKRDVILIQCPDHGKVKAGRDIHCKDSNPSNLEAGWDLSYYMNVEQPQTMGFSNGTAGTINTMFPTVYLINYTVKNAIFFKDNEGKSFRGKIIMDSRSSIGDMETTKENADVAVVDDDLKSRIPNGQIRHRL